MTNEAGELLRDGNVVWSLSTLDQEIAKHVRGWRYNTSTDSWIGDQGPDKLMSMSQIAHRWTGSLDAAIGQLESVAHKIDGYSMTLVQKCANPGPGDFTCTVDSSNGIIAYAEAGTPSMAVCICVLVLALKHGIKP